MLTARDYGLLVYERRRRQRAKQNYTDYLEAIDQDYDWRQPHHIYLAKQLDDLLDQKINKLMIMMPPRHGKSAMATIRLPVRWLERYPTHNVLVIGHTQGFADDFSRASRRIARERHLLVDKRCDRIAQWQLEAGGMYRCYGINGGITGKGGQLIVIDDPIKSAEQAYSQVYRDKIWQAYSMDIRTRREPPHRAIILIQTRWHEDDLAGRILASDEADEWTIVNLPAIAGDNDILGRAAGDALWADRYDVDFLERERALFPKEFSALFQQRPTSETGAVYDISMIQYYDKRPALDGHIILSIDTAFGGKEGNDYSVIQTMMYKDGCYYGLDLAKGHWSYDDLKSMIISYAQTYRPHKIVLESQGAGVMLNRDLRKDYPIMPVKPLKDKVARAHCTTHIFDTAKFYLPTTAGWVSDYINELASFPAGKHDDCVDTTSQGLRYLCDKFGYALPNINTRDRHKIVRAWRF